MDKSDKEKQLLRLSKWSRSQLEGDVIRLWQVEIDCLEEIRKLNQLLMDNHICSDCGAVSVVCGCPFG